MSTVSTRIALTDETEAPTRRGQDPERDAAVDAIWATARDAVRRAREEGRSDACRRRPRPREGWRG